MNFKKIIIWVQLVKTILWGPEKGPHWGFGLYVIWWRVHEFEFKKDKTKTLFKDLAKVSHHWVIQWQSLEKTVTFCDTERTPFILMGDFNGHHTLWGCEDVNNRGQQLEDLILKNDLILLNDKSHTYFHSASGTFTSIDLTLCSPSLFFDFSWKVGPDPCGSDHFPILLENGWPPSLERVQRWKLAKANWDQFQHLCSRCWWSHVFVYFHLEGHCCRNYS